MKGKGKVFAKCILQGCKQAKAVVFLKRGAESAAEDVAGFVGGYAVEAQACVQFDRVVEICHATKLELPLGPVHGVYLFER